MNAWTDLVNDKEATKPNYLPIFAQDPLSTAKVAGLLQQSGYQEILEEMLSHDQILMCLVTNRAVIPPTK